MTHEEAPVADERDHDLVRSGAQNSLLASLADRLADARVAYDDAEAVAATLKLAYDAIEKALFDAMEAGGLTSIRTERGLFRLNDLAWARIDDPAAARTWAELHLPELITLNSSRLSKLVRDALKGEAAIEGGTPDPATGTALPTGVSYTTSRKITWRRS